MTVEMNDCDPDSSRDRRVTIVKLSQDYRATLADLPPPELKAPDLLIYVKLFKVKYYLYPVPTKFVWKLVLVDYLEHCILYQVVLVQKLIISDLFAMHITV